MGKQNNIETQKNTELLHSQLSYKIRGAVFLVRKEYGPGHKEVIYHRLLAEELQSLGLKVIREKQISIYSNKSKKRVGTYIPMTGSHFFLCDSVFRSVSFRVT